VFPVGHRYQRWYQQVTGLSELRSDRVCWPIAATGTSESRPQALVQALAERNLTFGPRAYHGRTPGPGRRPWSALLRASQEDGRSVVLSPLFLNSEMHAARWIDLYDDWSLAPEMNPAVRALARVGYSKLRRSGSEVLVTVNSRYMRDMLSPVRALLVPNGVDPVFGDCPRANSAVSSLVMIGNFFDGRTDWDLMSQLVRVSTSDEVLIYGANEQVQKRLGERGIRETNRVRMLPRTHMLKIFEQAGPASVVAIPHVVSDYTMSQDLMKAYQAVAAGCRVVVPAPLAPPSIPIEFIFMVGPGADVGAIVTSALNAGPIAEQARTDFAREHSWDRRAAEIERHLT
jgi:hypothetical protein